MNLPEKVTSLIASQLAVRSLVLFASTCKSHRRLLFCPIAWSTRDLVFNFSFFAFLCKRGALRKRRILELVTSKRRHLSWWEKERPLLPLLEELYLRRGLRDCEFISLFQILPKESMRLMVLNGIQLDCLFEGAIFAKLTSLDLTVHSFARHSEVIARQCPNLSHLRVKEGYLPDDTYSPTRYDNLVSLCYDYSNFRPVSSGPMRCFLNATELKSLDLRNYESDNLYEWMTLNCHQLECLYFPRAADWDVVIEMLTNWRFSLKKVLLSAPFVKQRLDQFLEQHGAQLCLETVYYHYGTVKETKRKKLLEKCPSLKAILRK